jgi:hypothetical protein
MKKTIGLVLLTAIVASVYFGCKKGPEDPFLSFKSRESRMVGTWKCSEYTVDGIDSLTAVIVTSAAGSAPCGSVSYSVSLGKSFTLILGNDGNYNKTTYKDSTWTVSFQNPTASLACKSLTGGFTGKVDTVQKGIWEFAGGVGQYNNKELLELVESTDGAVGENFEIVECSSKQLKLTETKTIPAVPSKLIPDSDSIPAAAHVYAWTYKH